MESTKLGGKEEEYDYIQILSIVCGRVGEVRITGGSLQKSEESLELAWFSSLDIPFEQFAFRRHREVLERWLEGQGSV
jgi:hypothetical protein